MKKILFLVVGLGTIFNLASCSSDDDNNGTSGSNSKKYLAEITVKEYPWKYGERSSYGDDYESYKYDEKGNLLEKITNYYSTSAEMRIWCRYLYTYDDRNRLIEMDYLGYKNKYQYNEFDSLSVAYHYGDEGKTLSEFTYEYDSNRRLYKKTEHVVYMGPDYKYVSVYSYNGNTVKEVTTLSTTVLKDFKSSTRVWEYDSNKHLIKETYTDDWTGLVEIDNTYEYNAKGQISRKTSREYAIGDDFSYCDYYYNEDGTIDRIHVSYSFKDDKSDLVYTYTWK